MEEKTILNSNFNEKYRDPFFHSLPLNELQENYLLKRWRDRIDWNYTVGLRFKKRHLMLKMITILGCLLLSVLTFFYLKESGYYLFIGLSLLVTISVIINELNKYAERSEKYLELADNLKNEGWQFSQLIGDYRFAKDHQEAFLKFTENVEAIIKVNS